MSERIKIITKATEVSVEQDVVSLGSIFERLYRPDLSDTYFLLGNVFHDRIEGYGVIYTMNVRLLQDEGNNKPIEYMYFDVDGHRDRIKKAAALYPKFEESFTDNILEYGKTLKSLDDREIVDFEITIVDCIGCDISEFLTVSVKSDVLRQYKSGEITKNNALKEVRIEKGK